MSYSLGVARKDITCFIPGIGMMGYGQPHNTVKEIATPLWARCCVLRDGANNVLVLIHLEICFITLALKDAVLEKLQALYPEKNLTHASLLLTAQHTHAAPGGYSHYPFYNFTIPGFQKKVFETLVAGCVEAAQEAFQSMEQVELRFGEVSVPLDQEVAFNRSMSAYRNNPEAKEVDPSEAVDRRMRGLWARSADGKLKALINWFGVHATSISSFNHRIHHDNKGVAAELFEKHHPGAMAFFLQSAAGDISPNFIWDKKLKRMRGKFQDQYENAAFNGELQFRQSEKVPESKVLDAKIETHHYFYDVTTVAATPAHGIAFFQGTLEGPGIGKGLASLLKGTSRLVRKVQLLQNPKQHNAFYELHAPKDVLLDHRSGSFLGIPLRVWKSLPPIPEPSVEAFRLMAKAQALETLPWVPTILPFQIIRLGHLLIIALPGEITTVAAQRIEALIQKELASSEIKEIIISSYANAYMGYVTTPEEYDQQSYEAGHTVYGRRTLEAMTAGILPLLKVLKGEASMPSSLTPFKFPAEELARRSF